MVCACVCVFVFTCVCLSICFCVCVCVCVCVCEGPHARLEVMQHKTEDHEKVAINHLFCSSAIRDIVAMGTEAGHAQNGATTVTTHENQQILWIDRYYRRVHKHIEL